MIGAEQQFSHVGILLRVFQQSCAESRGWERCHCAFNNTSERLHPTSHLSTELDKATLSSSMSAKQHPTKYSWPGRKTKKRVFQNSTSRGRGSRALGHRKNMCFERQGGLYSHIPCAMSHKSHPIHGKRTIPLLQWSLLKMHCRAASTPELQSQPKWRCQCSGSSEDRGHCFPWSATLVKQKGISDSLPPNMRREDGKVGEEESSCSNYLGICTPVT